MENVKIQLSAVYYAQAKSEEVKSMTTYIPNIDK